MTPGLRALSSVLLTGVLLLSSQAEARFGKRSAPSDSNSDDKTRAHDASPVDDTSDDSDDVHDASPVTERRPSPPPREQSQRPSPPPSRPRSSDCCESDYFPEVRVSEVSEADAVSLFAPVPEGVAYDTEEYRSRRSKNFQVGYEMQALSEGHASGVHLGVEGEAVGAMLRVSGLTLRSDDGLGGEDMLYVVGAHLSWAVLRGPGGRLRLEGGLAVVDAPDATFVGPSLGLSSELYLSDSFALEGRAHVTPVPYRQLDLAGGVVWYVLNNLIAVRGGMRVLVLNDLGAVDGIVHQDAFPGPYAALGLAL